MTGLIILTIQLATVAGGFIGVGKALEWYAKDDKKKGSAR